MSKLATKRRTRDSHAGQLTPFSASSVLGQKRWKSGLLVYKIYVNSTDCGYPISESQFLAHGQQGVKGLKEVK